MDIEVRLHPEQRRSHAMMKIPLPVSPFLSRACSLLLCICALTLPFLSPLQAQTTGPQQLAFIGLRTAAGQGQFNAVQSDAAGKPLPLLLDQRDGIRLLKTDATATNLLAQTYLGTKGDVGLAMALDPGGNVYVTGTSSSGSLTGTPNSAFAAPADTSTNSFVAKFDANLNPLFLTFAGGGRMAAASISATANAVYITGSIFAATLPVTPAGIIQSPCLRQHAKRLCRKIQFQRLYPPLRHLPQRTRRQHQPPPPSPPTLTAMPTSPDTPPPPATPQSPP